MLELQEYKQVPRKGSLCEKINKEIMLEKARTPEVKQQCEALLKSKNIDYGFVNPTVEPRISKDCRGMFEYDIVCKYIDKNGVYKEEFNTGKKTGSCNRFIMLIILIVVVYYIFKN
jgi:hypothetical protein